MSYDELLKKIDLNATSSIVDDFAIFFDFLDKDLPVSDKLKAITGQKLQQLNQLMTNPLQIKINRPIQASHPNINGLYLLGLSSGLVKRQLKGKKWHIVQNKTLFKQWDRLSKEQKYLNLLVTWLTADPEIIDVNNILINPLFFIKECFVNLSTSEWSHPEKISIYTQRYESLFNVALAEMFGLVELVLNPEQPKWHIEQIKLTALGSAMVQLIYEQIINSIEDSHFFTTRISTDIFEYALTPYFPYWSYLSPYPDPKPNGRYTIKLIIHEAQATFSISHYATLHELALFILTELVDFDVDHLYRFNYQDARYQNHAAGHPYLYEDKNCQCADEISLQDINFDIGQELIFIYDLGDNWTFQLVIIDFIEGGEDEPPQIIETKGEPPKQYGYYEDDDEEEDFPDCEFD